MKKYVLLFVALIVVLTIFLLIKGPKAPDQVHRYGIYTSGPLKFQASPLESQDVAAEILEKKYSFKDLYERSPVLKDLNKQEAEILIEAGITKIETEIKTSEKPNIELFIRQPTENFNLEKYKTQANIQFLDQAPTNIDSIIKINGKDYTRNELVLNQVQLSRIQTDQFYERLLVLQDLYTKALLLKDSKQENVTIQKLISDKIMPDDSISNDEILAFARKNNVDISQKSQELKITLSNIILQNRRNAAIDKYIAKNHPNEIGKIFFLPPNYKIPIVENKALIPVSVNKAERPTLIVFSSFNCGNTCKILAESLESLKNDHKDKVRIGFVQLFSDNDWRSRLIAEASLCIHAQNYDAYWDFFKKITHSQDTFDETKINNIAKSTNIDFDKFKKCFVTQTFKDDVNNQLKYARDIGVISSPTIVIGTEVLQGTILRSHLQRAMEANLL
ncbi:MAG: thioredoxin domain-containing protein [Bdellovibrionaceae bacterium]|nr:thioredoxin domain-containing protein [Pseudobdellovibrionaceae bacterium]